MLQFQRTLVFAVVEPVLYLHVGLAGVCRDSSLQAQEGLPVGGAVLAVHPHHGPKRATFLDLQLDGALR